MRAIAVNAAQRIVKPKPEGVIVKLFYEGIVCIWRAAQNLTSTVQKPAQFHIVTIGSGVGWLFYHLACRAFRIPRSPDGNGGDGMEIEIELIAPSATFVVYHMVEKNPYALFQLSFVNFLPCGLREGRVRLHKVHMDVKGFSIPCGKARLRN